MVIITRTSCMINTIAILTVWIFNEKNVDKLTLRKADYPLTSYYFDSTGMILGTCLPEHKHSQ